MPRVLIYALLVAACGGRDPLHTLGAGDAGTPGMGAGTGTGMAGPGGLPGVPRPADGGPAGMRGPDAPWPPPPPPPGVERPVVEPPLPRPGAEAGIVDAVGGGPETGGLRVDAAAPREAGADLGPTSTLVLPGGACTDSGQCAVSAAAVCVPPSIGFPGGYCAAQGCSVSAQNCPGGAAAQCIPGDDGPICLSTCDPAAAGSCREGYVCVPIGGTFKPVCLPGCYNDDGCRTGKRCWRPPGELFGRCYDPQVQIGDPCVAATDCPANGLCISETDFGWPHGYCVTGGCRTSADCPPWAACTGDGNSGSCAIRCTKAADCRPGYQCSPAGRAREMICTPRCTTSSQCRNVSCHIGTGLC